jgi:Uma2 family endonuclease
MGTITKKRKYTYEDYLKTPDDKRYELIEGDLLMTPSPNARHQEILMNLSAMIHQHVMGENLGKVFFAPLDVHLGDNVVQPDILFISRERMNIIGEKNVQGAPDLVVEILSESTAYRDTIHKKKLYARFGVKECWLVAPEDRLVEVYTLKDKGEYQLLKTYTEENVIESHVVKGLKIELSKVFA